MPRDVAGAGLLVRFVAAALLWLAIVGHASAWSMIAVDQDGERAAEGCIAAAPFDSGMLMVTSEVADGASATYLRLEFKDPRISFGAADERVQTDWDFDAGAERHRLIMLNAATELGATIYFRDPPRAVLASSRTLTLRMQNVLAFEISLAGSRRTLADWEACIQNLAARPAPSVAGGDGPSFDCAKASSTSEKLICGNGDLAALDRELAEFYARAKQRAEQWEFIGDGGETAAEWFETNRAEEWSWREENCTDADCLLRWYAKRKALLRLLAESGFGDSGVDRVLQFENADTLITLQMAGGERNVIWSAERDDYTTLPGGEITILEEEPLLYRVDWQKSYLKAGGAIWFSTVRDASHEIVAVPPMRDANLCFESKADFAERALIDLRSLERVGRGRICVYR